MGEKIGEALTALHIYLKRGMGEHYGVSQSLGVEGALGVSAREERKLESPEG